MKFIRKNGRVIPIKEKGDKPSASFGKAFVGGHVAGAIALKLGGEFDKQKIERLKGFKTKFASNMDMVKNFDSKISKISQKSSLTSIKRLKINRGLVKFGKVASLAANIAGVAYLISKYRERK